MSYSAKFVQTDSKATGSFKGTLVGSLIWTWIGSSTGSSTIILMEKGEYGEGRWSPGEKVN